MGINGRIVIGPIQLGVVLKRFYQNYGRLLIKVDRYNWYVFGRKHSYMLKYRFLEIPESQSSVYAKNKPGRVETNSLRYEKYLFWMHRCPFASKFLRRLAGFFGGEHITKYNTISPISNSTRTLVKSIYSANNEYYIYNSAPWNY